MLDSFLNVAYTNEKRAKEQEQLVEKMASLPEDLLHKIVSGEEKLAFIGGFGDDCWIEKYKGSPLFEQAIELEKQELQARMAESARRTEDSEKFRAQDAARDELCIQKKLLDLQLLELEAGGGQGEEEVPEEGMPGEEPPPEEGAPPMEEEAPEEVPAEEPPAEEVPPAAAAPGAPPDAPPAPEKPKVDVKVAAARMRMAKVAKEAFGDDKTYLQDAAVGGVLGSHLGGGMGAARGGKALPWAAKGALLGSALVPAVRNGIRERRAEKAKEKKAEALFKEAVGLGMLAKAVGGAAKRVAKPAMNAARGAGGIVPGAQMAAKTIGATAPGALKTVGRAAKSYAKSNPLQAAGLAGGAGLATGAALS